MGEFCQECCACITRFCENCLNFIIECGFCLCCCLVGVVLVSLFCVCYYMFFLPTTPVVVFEHPELYDYDTMIIHRNDRPVNEEVEIDDTDFDSDPIEELLFREKRNPSTSTVSTTNLIVSGLTSFLFTEASLNFGSTTSESMNNRNKSKPTNQTTTNKTGVITDDSEPDASLSNNVIDTLFKHADTANIKKPLGLCRKNVNIKPPSTKVEMFSSFEASDLLSCINDLLKTQTEKKLCLQLDPESHAYLKWLLMTGTPKARHPKPELYHDFLFPTTCGTEYLHKDLHDGPDSVENVTKTEGGAARLVGNVTKENTSAKDFGTASKQGSIYG